jgi:hypothetical protein
MEIGKDGKLGKWLYSTTPLSFLWRKIMIDYESKEDMMIENTKVRIERYARERLLKL